MSASPPRPPRGDLTRAEIAERVWRLIARAAARGGDAPSMPEMAAGFGVAGSSVWHAVAMLCAGGLLERRKVATATGHRSVYRVPATGATTRGWSTDRCVRPFARAKRGVASGAGAVPARFLPAAE